jgi:phosphatidylserine/phosphatidylglycerophosphate/cardiolipin synthase-like enzyme
VLFKKCAKPDKKSNSLFHFRKPLFWFVVLILVGLHAWLVFASLSCKLPSKKEPICFYSNQTRQDLRFVIQSAIKEAGKTIHMVTFGLSDPGCLVLLEKKALEHVDMKIFYDERGSNHVFLSNHKAYALRPSGLVHQKILITDHNRVYLGSANFTKSSLQMHDNLMLGFYSEKMAQFLTKNTPFDNERYYSEFFQNQQLKLFLFPDKDNKAFREIQKLLRSAQKTIFVAMFTFTHPILLQELINAHQRGVYVQVHIDHESFKGASQKVVLALKKAHIPVYSNGSFALFHHKFVLIDQKTLLAGSANFTKSAFQKNHECFFILSPLNASQQKTMNQLTETIDLEKNISRKPFKVKKIHPYRSFEKIIKKAA